MHSFSWSLVRVVIILSCGVMNIGSTECPSPSYEVEHPQLEVVFSLLPEHNGSKLGVAVFFSEPEVEPVNMVRLVFD